MGHTLKAQKRNRWLFKNSISHRDNRPKLFQQYFNDICQRPTRDTARKRGKLRGNQTNRKQAKQGENVKNKKKNKSSFDPLKTQFANMRTTVKQNSKFIEFETPNRTSTSPHSSAR